MISAFNELTPLQINVLQVAIDHMIEHLQDVTSDFDPNGATDDLEYQLSQIERLVAAKKLQELTRS